MSRIRRITRTVKMNIFTATTINLESLEVTTKNIKVQFDIKTPDDLEKLFKNNEHEKLVKGEYQGTVEEVYSMLESDFIRLATKQEN